jgi:hypothetical protein
MSEAKFNYRKKLVSNCVREPNLSRGREATEAVRGTSRPKERGEDNHIIFTSRDYQLLFTSQDFKILIFTSLQIDFYFPAHNFIIILLQFYDYHILNSLPT